MSEEIKEMTAPTEEVAVETVAETEENAPIITMKKCLEAGVHFGHPTRKWNPKMSKYIYGERNGIYIIDLNKSVEKISEAYIALREIVRNKGKVLFVGTKKQVQEGIIEEALRSGSFYVTNRWLGGTLTNIRTILTRTNRLRELNKMEEEGVFETLPKKEVAALRKEQEKLAKNLNGIIELKKLPQAIFVADPTEEHIAVCEAKKLGIPVFAIVDTNADPDLIDYPIPANDDATKSVRLIITVLADAIVEAKGGETVVAYTKDEGEEVTMKDAIHQADKENAEKLAAIRAARKEQNERREKMLAERAARRAQREKENNQPKKEENKTEGK